MKTLQVILAVLSFFTGCGGAGYISSHGTVETQRANDALRTQSQWQDMQRQQQQTIDRSNAQWHR